MQEALVHGTVAWTAPGEVSQVTHYIVYLAASVAGAGKWQFGSDVAVGTNQGTMAADTAVGAYTHVVVYTKSSLVEQTTPTALSLTDVISSVSGVGFVDKDLDAGELGGVVTWTAPGDVSQVTHYVLYLVQPTLTTKVRLQVGSDVPVGTNRLVMVSETWLGNFTHVVVYTKSSFVEQTTPTVLSNDSIPAAIASAPESESGSHIIL